MSESVDSSAVGASQLANRRGFLLGITLAEIMLITLFVLLLLFRHYQEKAVALEKVESVVGTQNVNQLVPENKLPPGKVIDQTEIDDIWTTLVNCASGDSPECLTDYAKDEQELVEEGEIEQSELVEEGEIEEREPEEVAEESADPETLEEAKELIEVLLEEREVLRDAIARKAGDTPICTFEKARPGSGKERGPSISLGTFHIEADGITLIEKREKIRNVEVVDFVGDRYDIREVMVEVDRWPTWKKLSLEEFGKRGEVFVSIGDREAKKRKPCRFTFNYYMKADEATHEVYVNHYQKYFWPSPEISERRFLSLSSGR